MLDILLNEAVEFGEQAKRFLAGDVDEETFRTFRLKRGIYGQRQPGFQMVRIKVPSGIATAEQLRAMADVAEEYGRAQGHLTTRQDLQIHWVPLDRVQEAMVRMAAAGLTTREACGNSVRNVTACAIAGNCPDQAFDVRPYSLATTQRFMRNPLTESMPRKFKIAFSCSLNDCALGDINDIGAAALVRDGRRGFRLRIGGGLGPSPHLAEELYDFVPVEELGEVCDAILYVFNEYGNRKDRHRARFKFVLRQYGIQWVKEKIEEARATQPHPPFEVGLAAPAPIGPPVIATIQQGNVTSNDLRRLAALSEVHADGTVRFMIDQNIAFYAVAPAKVPQLERDLRYAGFRTEKAGELADVITCPGAATCNLGLTRSMDLGAELSRTFDNEADALARGITVRISGCPNSCGHHHIGQIGLYGNARKINGDSAPYYQLMVGGGKNGHGTQLAKAVASIPARLAPQAIEHLVNFYKVERQPGETFLEFVDRRGVADFRRELEHITSQTTGVERLLVDWGDEEVFAVKLGRSECSA